MTRNTASLLAVLALGFVLSPAVNADPPADKGKGQSASQPAVKAAAASPHTALPTTPTGRARTRPRNTARATRTTCTTRTTTSTRVPKRTRITASAYRIATIARTASKLKGQERKAYVEWCVDNGERYKYDDKRWTSSRSCYQKADDRNLSGEAASRSTSTAA